MSEPAPPLLSEDLLVVGLDPRSGRVVLGDHARLLVGAAVVVDLVRAGRLAVVGEDHDARVSVVDPRPVEPPVHRDVLDRLVRRAAPPTADDLADLERRSWLTRAVVEWAVSREGPGPPLADALSGTHPRERTLEHLEATGVLVPDQRRVLGLLPRHGHAVSPPSRRDDLVADLRAVLLEGRDPDARTGPLVALVGAANLWSSTLNGAAHLARWVPRNRRTEAAHRAEAVLALQPGPVRTALHATAAVIDHRNERRNR